MAFPDEIRNLDADALTYLLSEGAFGSPGSDNYCAVEKMLEGRLREQEDERLMRQEAREEENLSLARRAYRLSRFAIYISIAAILISAAVTILVAVMGKK